MRVMLLGTAGAALARAVVLSMLQTMACNRRVWQARTNCVYVLSCYLRRLKLRSRAWWMDLSGNTRG